MRICFLGTGGSWPTKRRNPIGITVSKDGTNILLDCGEGTQRQMLFTPVSPVKLDAILITHLHGDHFLGVMGLIQTMALNDRTSGLDIYGPPGIREAYSMGAAMCYHNLTFPIRVTALEPGKRFKVGKLNVITGEADHRIPALVYKVFEDERTGRFNKKKAEELGIPKGRLWSKLQSGKEVLIDNGLERRRIKPEMVLGPPRKGKSLVYTGDTYPTGDILELARGVDALIHEATFSSDLEERAENYRHSTSAMAARTAKEAGVRRLFLVHSSPRYSGEGEEKILLDEAKEIFPDTLMPEDLDTFEITR